jgi:tetratricopeptide (TPR) repeat protein
MPEQIGPYVVLEQVARGGMGVVMRGRDPQRGDEVAIKLLTSGGASAAAQKKRFRREVQAMTRLRHPNVVAIRSSGEHRGHPYLVMDFVDGQSLQDRLARSGPLRFAEAAELTHQLAGALEHAHRESLLHRDVKPANVILTPAGQPMLTDFGLVKATDGSQTKLSRTGTYMGTPGYWPPEQARGDLTAIDARSDVYALGATLYAALTGVPPIQGNSLTEITIATQERAPTPPSRLRPQLPPQLEQICLRCLEKDPGDRYPSAAALRDDLARFLGGDPLQDHRAPWVGRPALALALAIGAVGVIAAASIVLTEPGATPPAAAPQASPLSTPGDVADEETLTTAQQEARRLADVGLERANLQDWDAALEAYTRATELDPEYANAFKNLGVIHSAMLNWEASLAAFDRAIVLDPENVKIYAGRGTAREQLGDVTGAVSDYELALQHVEADDGLRPHLQQMLVRARASVAGREAPAVDLEAWLRLGAERMASRDFDEAEAAFAEVIYHDPSHVEAYLRRGEARFARGLRELAIEDYVYARSLMASDDPRQAEVERLIGEAE